MFRSLKASIAAAAVAVLVVLSMSAPGLAGGDEARQSAPAEEMLVSEAVSSPADMSLPADALVSEGDAEVFASRGVCSHSCEPCFLTCPDFAGLPQSCMRQCF